MTFSPKCSTGSEIRQKFLNFYAEKGHKILPSASLVSRRPDGVVNYCRDATL